jgi:predicted dehydrogenase
MLRFEMHRGRWLWCAGPEEPWHEEAAAPPDRDGLFVRQAESFLDAVENRTAPLCDLADAAQTLRVNLAILRSVESRGWETVAASQPRSQTPASALSEEA